VVRVLLDATAVPANRGGVGRYVDNLIPALVRAGAQVWVACQLRDRDHYGELSGRQPLTAPPTIERPPVRLLWEQTGLARLARLVRPDVLHSPHYTHPVRLAGATPLVVTLHDATFFTDPALHGPIKARFFRAATRLALRRAACCITVSQASADEFVRVAGADPARLAVAHLGVDRNVFRVPTDSERAAVRTGLNLADDQPYLAFLGTLEPRKNVPALIRGWIKTSTGRDAPPALVLAGGAGWDDQIDVAATEVPAALRLVRAGYLPIEQLAGLLGGAEVVAYPSLGEGFGLPVLEAMSCGAPVLTTRRLALPEVGGDAVAYTETDPDSISTALGSLLDDPERRRRLSAAGLSRAETFTWDACAAAHLTAYERAVGR
jgi:glycosyltransferase involved in cell wall biosynthesis